MFKIRTMSLADFDTVISWAAQEGWNPGLHDAQAFYETDPHGFFIGFLDNQPIASISAVSYQKKFGFIGCYIVKPEFRGQGYGIQLWQAAMQYLSQQNIGLDGVVAQQKNYQRSGFKFAYNNVRYESKSVDTNATSSKNLVALTKFPFAQLAQYDQKYFPAPREAFLRAWIQQPDGLALGFVEQGELKGYGVIRKCQNGYKLGPLFADNTDIAFALFHQLQAHTPPNSPLFLDIPEPNKSATALIQEYNMSPVFQTARMYTQTQPDINLEQVFGVTTFELG